ENIARYIEEGYPAYEAVVEGCREVIAPVVATISTTVAAFGPMLFMTGIFGKFIFFIPLVVIMALIASLLESFFVLPSHVYDITKMLPPGTKAEQARAKKAGRFKEWTARLPYGGSFDRFRDEAYVPILRWAVRRRLVVFEIGRASCRERVCD